MAFPEKGELGQQKEEVFVYCNPGGARKPRGRQMQKHILCLCFKKAPAEWAHLQMRRVSDGGGGERTQGSVIFEGPYAEMP